MPDFATLLLGKRLDNSEAESRKIGAFEGVPAMGLDGLGSSAYGPEAALTVLMPLGAASLGYIGWVMTPIVALLGILFFSYWQTIRAYPVNGGAYSVARENLGTNASLFAAAALMIDYVLNVAVGISAGVAALVSAFPPLHPHVLALCLGVLVLVTILNLRGTLDSGRVLALPTYLFVVSFGAIIALGLVRSLASGGHPQPLVAPPAPVAPTEAISAWLLLRAVASGCTAMTGVEAVSNGINAFRKPSVRYGHRTLSAIVLILGGLLLGIAYLAPGYGITALDQTQPGYQSVLSQLAQAVVGRGALYHVALGSALCVLALSANTSFVDFPRLCRAVAEHGYLPKAFTIPGRRLVYSSSILFLAVSAGLLLLLFDGITDRLIPLFAVGAFLSFTLSQASMVVHWKRILGAARRRSRRDLLSLGINALGAMATAAALVVIVAAKFVEGAWITLLALPCTIMLLKTINAYYRRLDQQKEVAQPLSPAGIKPPIVLIAIRDLDRLGLSGVRFALSISPDVLAVHLTELEGRRSHVAESALRERWKSQVEEPTRASGKTPPRLVLVRARRRTIHEPLLRLAKKLARGSPERDIAVLIPEVVPRRWYQHVLHAHRGQKLRSRLLKHGRGRLTVIVVPWHARA